MGLLEKSPGLITICATVLRVRPAQQPAAQSGKYFTLTVYNDWAVFVEALATLMFYWILKKHLKV